MDDVEERLKRLEEKLNASIQLVKETYLELVIVKLVFIGITLLNIVYYLSKYING